MPASPAFHPRADADAAFWPGVCGPPGRAARAGQGRTAAAGTNERGHCSPAGSCPLPEAQAVPTENPRVLTQRARHPKDRHSGM